MSIRRVSCRFLVPLFASIAFAGCVLEADDGEDLEPDLSTTTESLVQESVGFSLQHNPAVALGDTTIALFETEEARLEFTLSVATNGRIYQKYRPLKWGTKLSYGPYPRQEAPFNPAFAPIPPLPGLVRALRVSALQYEDFLHLFIVGSDGRIYIQHWTTSGWTAPGLLDAHAFADVSAVNWGHDIHVFATGQNGALYRRRLVSGVGWQPLEGLGAIPGVALQRLSAMVFAGLGGGYSGSQVYEGIPNNPQRLWIGFTSTAHKPYFRHWAPATGWSGFSGFPTAEVAVDIAVAEGSVPNRINDETIEFFTANASGALHNNAFDLVRGTFSGWVNLGGGGIVNVSVAARTPTYFTLIREVGTQRLLEGIRSVEIAVVSGGNLYHRYGWTP